MALRIRDFDPGRDEPAALSFIGGSQSYEYAIERDRRLDAAVAGEHYAGLLRWVAEDQGRMFLAEDGGAAIGWAVFVVRRNDIFVVEAERTYGYIAELFVVEQARGGGVGRALIGACEDEARRLGLGQIKLGVLTNNRRAFEIYVRAGYGPYTSELRKYL